MKAARSFTTRLSLALALLLLAYGAFVALLGREVAIEQEQESLQRLSHGLAGHIVGHWPEIASPNRDAAEQAARSALLAMLMTVNPGVQVYLLDADGRVQHYIGEPGMVRQEQVDLDPVRAFLAGGALPLRSTDPMGSGVPRIFSAAMFPVRDGDRRPPGYLYVILDSPAREAVAAQVGADRLWRGAALAAVIGLLVTLGMGLFTFRRLTLRLHRLAQRLRSYSQ
ncbi:MAG TPA: sensor histidine kinase, partial [Rubrivivax sp.]|nr:sensor histidine kinase [Rubrivivax sp.]